MNATELVQVQERRSRTIETHTAANIPPSFWAAADCTVQRAPMDALWTLSAGDSVGISRISTPGGTLTLEVTPKLPEADIFFLADYAFGQRHEPLRLLDFDDAMLDAVRDNPTACLLMWHTRTINQFASRWLRRDYRTTDRVFEGKVKGRILLDRYVRHHLAVGEASRIPCRANERTQDTPNNRILKAGLRYTAALSHTLPVPAARIAVRRQVNATLPKFAQVSDVNPTPSDIRATSIRGPQRHYGSVLRATLNLLSHMFLTNQLGGSPTQSFMWQMPVLFQEAVRGIVSSFETLTLDNSTPPSASIYNAAGAKLRSSKVDPDLVIGTSAGRYLLLDTKYKNVIADDGVAVASGDQTVTLPGKQRISVSRSDLYQAVAYREHERWRGAASGLLYPVSLPAGQPLPAPLHVRGFGPNIPLVFIDIGPNARRNLGSFRAELTKLQATELTESHGSP